MPIKDILAVVDTGDKDESFLQDALAFAEFHNARLTFVILSALLAEDYALTVGPAYVLLHDYVDAVEKKQNHLNDLSGPGNVEVRVISDQPGTIFATAAVYARYADLILFGPGDNYVDPPIRRETIQTILFASGRPVLVLPNGYEPRAFDHVALGWNASREATHALRDATAFAEPGARIDILVLDGEPTAKGHGSEPGADIAHHLARHGFAAQVVALARGKRSDAEALLNAAREQGAPLLALGAYGHSRLREMLLGGVTRDLLAGAPIALLFSH